jgi:hypothetical protein
MRYPGQADMARENTARRKFDTSVLREKFFAAVEAHGAGKILASEMPIDPKTNIAAVRYAPSYVIDPSLVAATDHPYTIEALARFLGLVKAGSLSPKDSFVAAFGAVELISEGYLNEALPAVRAGSHSRLPDLEM